MLKRSCAVLLVLASAAAARAADGPGRERLSMDANWRFHLDDPADVKPDLFAYPEQKDLAKAGADDFDANAELDKHRVDPVATHLGEDLPIVAAAFDDSKWDAVQVPHDWCVALPFDERGDKGHGYKKIGPKLGNTIGWYRRSFDLPATDKDRVLSVEFDGVYRNSLVWLNGHCLGRYVSGYSSFAYDISAAANYGGRNELVVRVDCTRTSGWFYEGAGIYRHVWLTKTPPVHVARWGAYVTADPTPDGASAMVVARAELASSQDDTRPNRSAVTQSILDADGHTVTTATAATGDRGGTAESRLTLPRPHLWSLESPYLYTLMTTVGGDAVRTPFGIRTIRFDPDHGFFLNGKHVPINGTCNHQDAAGVGEAIPDALNVWRLQQLKRFGCNAVRTSHNDPTPELLDACDRLGILVMDEHRLSGRTPAILDELGSLVRRDRNHPSVILWSIGNEEGRIQGKPAGEQIAKVMKAAVLKLDDTRPVTAAMDHWGTGGFSNVIDVQGFNYALKDDITKYHAAHPGVPLMGSEEASTVSTRGVYTTSTGRAYVSAYDVNAPDWATTAERWVTYFGRRPYLAGAFVWTGFDYRGEPTPYAWPCISSHFGVLDTCGFFKDEAYYYQSAWTDKPMVHLLPHWNWAGREGMAIDVWAYTNGDEVELLEDGRSLGREKVAPGTHAEWMVPYDPGTLVANAYRDGQLVATDTVATTGPAAEVVLSVDRTTIDADGADVAVVNVAVADAAGRTMPTAGNLIHFKVDGPGRNIGVGNGDPTCHEPDHAGQRSAFNGRCQMILQSDGHPGPITVTATADGLATATATVTAAPGPPRPAVP